MMMQMLPQHKKFLMRKKLSSNGWVLWAISLSTIIAISILFFAIELVKIHSREVYFFNIKTVNTENNKVKKIKNEAVLNVNTPVIIFNEQGNLLVQLKT